MAKNTKTVNFNLLSRSGAHKRRFDFLSEKSKEMLWSLDEISRGTSGELRSQLRQELAKATSFSDLKVTSAEQLEAWGRTKDAGRPYLGNVVATNVPVLCMGHSVTDRNKDLLKSRGLSDDHPKHTGFDAHRLTWGTMYVKPQRVVNAAGDRVTSSFTHFSACNQCLDKFLGKLGKDGRKTNLWPKEWTLKQHKGNKPNKGKKGKSKPRAPTSSATQLLLATVNGQWKDPLRKVTLTMWKAVAKEQGFKASGNKSSHLQAWEKHLIAMGDKDLDKAWKDALSS